MRFIYRAIVFFSIVGSIGLFGQESAMDRYKKYYHATVSGRMEGEISKDDVLRAGGLTLNDSLVDRYKIIHFKLTLICKGKDEESFEQHLNNRFTPLMLDAIRKAQPGCKMYVEYIKLMSADSEYVQLSAMAFRLK